MYKKIKDLFVLATLTTTLCAPIATAETTLRYAEFGPNKGWRAEVHNWLNSEITERSKGEYEINSVFGGALIKSSDVVRGVGAGIADLGTFVAVYKPKEFENYRVGDIPIGSNDSWVGMRAIYKVATTNPVVKSEFDRQSVEYLGNYTSSPVILSCSEEVSALSDLNGLKIRANPPHSDVLRTFGATIVSVPIPEIYQALDRGIIDCAQSYWSSVKGYRLNEVAHHITELNWSENLGFGLIMNKRKFDSLPPEDQSMLKELGSDLVDFAAKTSMEEVRLAKQSLLQDSEMQVHTLSGKDHEKLLQESEKIASQFKGAPSVLEDYRDAVKEFEEKLQADGYPWGDGEASDE